MLTMNRADKAVLRLTLGLGLAVLVAYGFALPMPFVVWRTVGYGQIVVHCLGNSYAHDWLADFSANLADLVCGVLLVTATIVEKETDVVRAKHFDQALVLSAVLVDQLEFVAARPKRSTRGVV